MLLFLIGGAILGLLLMVVAMFLRENRAIALAMGGLGLLMVLGAVGLFVLVVSQMR